jgi:hypothetical protein
MSFTLGHAQKAITICAKHQWCHGMYHKGAFPIPPTDSKILSAARLEVRRRGAKPILTQSSWSKADTKDAIQAFWSLEQQAVGARMPWAVWELFAFNVGGDATIVAKVPTDDAVRERQQDFLRRNTRAADPGSSLPAIRESTKHDALRSTFTQGTWPWSIPVTKMGSQQLSDKASMERLIVDESWRRSLRYTTSTEGMTPRALLVDMADLCELVRTSFTHLI